MKLRGKSGELLKLPVGIQRGSCEGGEDGRNCREMGEGRDASRLYSPRFFCDNPASPLSRTIYHQQFTIQ